MSVASQREQRPTAAIVHLSGARRGVTERLSGEVLRVGTGSYVEIDLSRDGGESVAPVHATLHHRDSGYELETEPGQEVWVNGEKVDRRMLVTGDILEIGEDGPILRFRLYPPGISPYKSMEQAFSDCLECARRASESRLGRLAGFLRGAPRELATQTSGPFRAMVVVVLLALGLTTVWLARHSRALEQQLEEEVAAITALVESSEERVLDEDDLLGLRLLVEERLIDTAARVEALESRSTAVRRVIERASPAVVFLQGSFGFVEPESERFIRFVGLGPDGRPLATEAGEPRMTLEGDGPILESLYTGTAFVASEDGRLFTNRHVAVPWDYDASAQALVRRGFEPRMRRFVGYLPGRPESFDVELVAASDEADIALLRCEEVTRGLPFLPLATKVPAAGEQVIVLGYPTGIRALLARTDRAFVQSLMLESGLDFWGVVEKLAREGRIGPLASQGIVGQTSGAAIVYDAETTQGGSGGPVVDLEGRVVAVNAAILPEFGGSNLGVPAEHGRRLLARAGEAEGREPAASGDAVGDR